MSLKTKLPLIFLLMFVIMFLVILISFVLYIKSLVSDESHIWLGNIFSPIHFQILLLLSVLISMIFVVLTVYFHFNITKPIETLNLRLAKVNIGNARIPLHSNRKDEIGELYNHFNEMEDRLYQAHKEQLDMITAIAHDLKTPLTTINGFMELLSLQKNLTEKKRLEYYELIIKKSNHIVELINAFSELTVETTDMKLIEANSFFENIAAEYSIELSSFDYKLIWRHSFNSQQLIRINEHMIRRVFGNLFSNAVKYGGEKELTVYLTGYAKRNYVYFQIEDNGVGVPDGDLSSLFFKFFTVDKSRQTNSGGSGLGLASCKLIIEHYGGKIIAFQSDHGGLGIRFSLPFAS